MATEEVSEDPRNRRHRLQSPSYRMKGEIMDEILRQRKPEVAQFVERWQSRYQRTFDLKDPGEQATFYEGVLELARHLAAASESATARVSLSVDGVTGLTLAAQPLPSESDASA
jgi:phosphoglycolate phosphatase-like HAD superfamily hydrolase